MGCVFGWREMVSRQLCLLVRPCVRCFLRRILCLALRAPEVFLQARSLRSVEFVKALMRELRRHLFHLGHLDVIDLVPWIDEASVDEKAGFGPAFDERSYFAFYILLMLDGQ